MKMQHTNIRVLVDTNNILDEKLCTFIFLIPKVHFKTNSQST